jgi:hypothetical protein
MFARDEGMSRQDGRDERPRAAAVNLDLFFGVLHDHKARKITYMVTYLLAFLAHPLDGYLDDASGLASRLWTIA